MLAALLPLPMVTAPRDAALMRAAIMPDAAAACATSGLFATMRRRCCWLILRRRVGYATATTQ